jgi:hypothetical protein
MPGQLNRCLAIAMAVTITVLLGRVSATEAQTDDAESVLRAREAALMTRDVERVLAVFADDADVTTSSGRHFTDKQGVRSWIQEQVDRNQREEVVGTRRMEGGRLTWNGKVYRTDWANLGVSPLDVIQEAIVEGGKIKLFVTSFTQESAAWLNVARAAQPSPQAPSAAAPAQAPRSLPAAGSASSPVGLVVSMAAVGMTLLLAGLALRRSHPRLARGSCQRQGQ